MKSKSRKIKHAVIIVNYNGGSDTLDCVRSITATKDTPHIIVVDNGSTNDSVKELKKNFPTLDLIPSTKNLGFSAANNLGIKKSLKMGAQVIYLLNNDTEVDSNLFFRAYRYVEKKNRIAGGKIYYAKGYEFNENQRGQGNILWYAGGQMDWSTAVAKHTGVDEVDLGQYDKTRPVDFITGCFMAIPRAVLKKTDLLDESFFLYLEDADFCLHAQKLGVEVIYNPRLLVYHRNSSATISGSPLVDYYLTRNRFFIAKRYAPLRLRFALWREAVLRNWNSRIRRQAFFDYLRGRMGNRNEQIKP
jgi:hypothetical protein